VFTVWEPILVTDWKKPGSRILARISEPRVKQLWDPEHLVAKQLAGDARPPQQEPGCCTRNGIFWDLAAVYPPDAQWTQKMPPATLFDGAVVKMEAEIEAAIRKLATVGGEDIRRPLYKGRD
jgi:hypothetical protein